MDWATETQDMNHLSIGISSKGIGRTATITTLMFGKFPKILFWKQLLENLIGMNEETPPPYFVIAELNKTKKSNGFTFVLLNWIQKELQTIFLFRKLQWIKVKDIHIVLL